MLSKPAAMLAGLICKRPLNAYEIIKQLTYMNVRWWFNVGDSTVYATLKTLEKRALISGTAEKAGNMPERTVYTSPKKARPPYARPCGPLSCNLITIQRLFPLPPSFWTFFRRRNSAASCSSASRC